MKEATLQRAIQEAIRRKGGKVIKVHGGPHGVAGTPDLIGALYGKSFAIEVKVPGGRLTRLQAHELQQWAEQGWKAGVAHSVEEALQIITQEEQKE